MTRSPKALLVRPVRTVLKGAAATADTLRPPVQGITILIYHRVGAGNGGQMDLAPDAFPFMALRDGTVAGERVRLARVSFTGELSFELHVAADRGPALWDAIWSAGSRKPAAC